VGRQRPGLAAPAPLRVLPFRQVLLDVLADEVGDVGAYAGLGVVGHSGKGQGCKCKLLILLDKPALCRAVTPEASGRSHLRR
jgi:hypothetical protein